MLYGTTGEWPIDQIPWSRGLRHLDGRYALSDVLAQSPIDRLDHAPTVAGGALVIVCLVALVLYVSDRLRTGQSGTESGSTGDQPTLTDRERIERLLDENGGRMKQAEIVDSVEWSKAKVSRLLADLEADDEITKLRLGRENLICRAGSEPAASRSGGNRRGTQPGDE